MSTEHTQENLISRTNDNKKITRKAVFRRTVDYNSSISLFIEQRAWKRKYSARSIIQPDFMYQHLMTPTMDYRDNPMNAVCAKHVRTSTNKNKYPIYVSNWTPDGRRLITGSASGEFTLWNGLTFNFETILQAHDSSIRAMTWSHNEECMVSADDLGFVKYWQSNMNDINVFQAHKDPIRGVSFCPTDKKFATCSIDNTVRIWDFQNCKEERVLRGHGSDVVCINWHPTKSLLLSGSKDSQKPLNLWDPKSGDCISTMYVHKSTCTDIQINRNGNWFLTSSKDHYIKLFDLRNLKNEMQVFRGHKKEVNCVAWHPFHESLFVSGSGDGSLLYWLVGMDLEVGSVENAHDNIIWTVDWHPLGHILVSGSNDFSTKFWTRNQPGEIINNLQEEQSKADLDFGPNAKNFFYGTDKPESVKLTENCKKDAYDIPGLSENIALSYENLADDDFENKELNSKEMVNRVIPLQFSQNWENKVSVPIVKLDQVLKKNNIQSNISFPIRQPFNQPLRQIFPLKNHNIGLMHPNANPYNVNTREEPFCSMKENMLGPIRPLMNFQKNLNNPNPHFPNNLNNPNPPHPFQNNLIFHNPNPPFQNNLNNPNPALPFQDNMTNPNSNSHFHNNLNYNNSNPPPYRNPSHCNTPPYHMNRPIMLNQNIGNHRLHVQHDKHQNLNYRGNFNQNSRFKNNFH